MINNQQIRSRLEPTLDKGNLALREFKNGKSPGLDTIIIDILGAVS